MHTLNRGLVEQHVAVYGKRDAHWMASLESRVTGRVDDPDLDCWTRTAMPQYSSVHNSIAQGEKRDDPRSSPIFKWRTELDLHRPRPHSSALVTIRSWKGSILDETKIIVPTRKRSYIYTYRSLKSYSRNVAHLHWIQSSILLRQQNCIKFPRDYFRIICCDLGEGFPKKKMKRGERIGYDKSVNLIRGTRSWGDWRVLVVGARRVWTELERVHAPRRRERGETRARDAGRVWWTWFVCIPRPWGGRQSSMEIIVAHGARCPSSTDLSLFPVQLIPVPSPFLRVYEASKETRIEVEKEKRMIYRYNRPL